MKKSLLTACSVALFLMGTIAVSSCNKTKVSDPAGHHASCSDHHADKKDCCKDGKKECHSESSATDSTTTAHVCDDNCHQNGCSHHQ